MKKLILFILLLTISTYAQHGEPVGGGEIDPDPQPIPAKEIEKKIEDAKNQTVTIGGNHIFPHIFMRIDDDLYEVISDSSFEDIQNASVKDSATVENDYKIVKRSRLVKIIKVVVKNHKEIEAIINIR